MTDEPVRLAKRVAALAGCSRRDAELYIEGGWVRVDGEVVREPPFRVGDEQRVDIDPAARLDDPRPVTLLLHKPPHLSEVLELLAPEHHAPHDSSTLRPMERHFTRLTPLLPLPELASGLDVFSQDGGVIRRLTEDAGFLEQEVIADVQGELGHSALAHLRHGLRYRGYLLPRIKVSWQNEGRLRFALKGIAPDVVPWMCEQVGGRVTGLRRLRIGSIPLAGLPSGKWRYLGARERF
jgi:23S rRNA pseudouridine2604 synthase